jgi:hypothetical protein
MLHTVDLKTDDGARVIELFDAAQKSWSNVEVKSLKPGDIFQIKEPDGSLVKLAGRGGAAVAWQLIEPPRERTDSPGTYEFDADLVRTA